MRDEASKHDCVMGKVSLMEVLFMRALHHDGLAS